jgi:hypothetical protein
VLSYITHTTQQTSFLFKQILFSPIAYNENVALKKVVKISVYRPSELNLYSSPSIVRVIKSRRMRWAGHAARMGERRNAYRILVGKPDGKRPLGRPRRRWVDNIKMDLREVGWDGRDWIDLAQDRDQWRAYMNAVMNLRVP